MSANPVQVVVIAQPGTVDKQIKYRNMKTGLARQLVAFGILQLLIGILCIIFQGVAVGIFANQSSSRYAYMYSIDFVGHGFWCGIMVSNTLMSGCGGSVLGSVMLPEGGWFESDSRRYVRTLDKSFTRSCL